MLESLQKEKDNLDNEAIEMRKAKEESE